MSNHCFRSTALGLPLLLICVVVRTAPAQSDELPEDLRPALIHGYTTLGPEQKKRWDQRFDKQQIVREAEMKRDQSPQFIELPGSYREGEGEQARDFDVADQPPTVDFAIVQGLEPFYQPEKTLEYEHPVWGGWGEVERGPDGRFFFSLGNHRAHGANAVIVRYDPASRKQKVVLQSKQVNDWSPDEHGDSKYHGTPTIAPNGEMWLLTLNSPSPREKDWGTRYWGGWLNRYNTRSGESENLGIVLQGDSWLHHDWDWQRGLLVAVGRRGTLLAYDTDERRVLYGGRPPFDRVEQDDRYRYRHQDDVFIHGHSLFLDPKTGLFYGSLEPGGYHRKVVAPDPHHLFHYDRNGNQFQKLEASVPPHPDNDGVAPLSAATARRDAEGRFWCFAKNGVMFTFNPETETVEYQGLNWQEGKYTYNVRLSPDKRYLYYAPGSDTAAWQYGTPIVQYDIENDRRKVIAFLDPYYRDAYGYSPGGTYGLALDAKGESLFIYTNGQFTPEDGRSGYGRPAIFHVHIPAAERGE